MNDSKILQNTKARRVFSKSQILLFGTILLGILADVLFYQQNLGISIPIFVLAFYAICCGALRRQFSAQGLDSVYLFLSVILLSFSYLFFSNIIFMALNFLVIPILIVMQTSLASGQSRAKSAAFILDILFGFLYRPFVYCLLPFRIVGHFLIQRSGLKKESILLKILAGIGLTIPLLLLVVPLLSSADQIFNHLLGRIPSLFVRFDLGSLIGQIIFSGIIAVLSFSYIWSLRRPGKNFWSVLEMNSGIGPNFRLDRVIILTVLTVINALYLFFTLIQFSYLFGGLDLGLPAHFTYSEYARRGFFELVIVTLINLSLLVIFFHFTKKETGAMVRWLESLLVGCTLIILASAFIRMAVYENVYGYTRLRIITHAFMIFLFVLFIGTCYRIWQPKMKLFRFYLLTALAFFVVLNYANIDGIITKSNIVRYETTGKIDANYLATLSDDAIPQRVQLIRVGDSSVRKHVEMDLIKRHRQLNSPQSWQSFNLSHDQAKKILDNYHLND
ncbi:MAG: DUF4153 domain-containing protein [Sporolactobacillus sp.]